MFMFGLTCTHLVEMCAEAQDRYIGVVPETLGWVKDQIQLKMDSVNILHAKKTASGCQMDLGCKPCLYILDNNVGLWHRWIGHQGNV